jgi:hypothetical protein
MVVVAEVLVGSLVMPPSQHMETVSETHAIYYTYMFHYTLFLSWTTALTLRFFLWRNSD